MGKYRNIRKQAGSPYWYYEFQRKGHRYVGPTPFRLTESEFQAYQWLQEQRTRIIAERAAGLSERANHEPEKLTVEMALNSYWEEYARHKAGAGTTRGHLAEWNRVLSDVVYLADLTTSDIRRGKVALATPPPLPEGEARRQGRRVDKRGERTLGRYLRTLQAVWNYHLKDSGIVPPRFKDEMPPEAPSVQNIMPEDAETAFLEWLPPDRRNLHEFNLLAGMRKGSVTKIRLEHVDLQSENPGLWHWVHKQKGRPPLKTWLALAGRLLEIVTEEYGQHETHLFSFVAQVTSGSGAKRREKGKRYPYTPQTALKDIVRARKAGVVPAGFRFHDGRHTAGTRITHRFGLRDAQVILGHQSPVTTAKYAHVDDARQREVFEGLSARAREKSQNKSQNTDRDDGTGGAK